MKNWLKGKYGRLVLAIGVGSVVFIALILMMVLQRKWASWKSAESAIPKTESASSPDTPQLFWEDLAALDYQKAIIPPSLEKFDNTIVSVPGFAVPLEDYASEVSEFLLVPNGMACIHAPPPPPNQMVLVKFEQTLSYSKLRGPIWVTGKLKIVDTQSKYGSSTYEMVGQDVRAYQFEE